MFAEFKLISFNKFVCVIDTKFLKSFKFCISFACEIVRFEIKLVLIEL